MGFFVCIDDGSISALYCTETTGNTLAIQFQLKSVREWVKQGGVVSDKKADTHSCSIFFKG